MLIFNKSLQFAFISNIIHSNMRKLPWFESTAQQTRALSSKHIGVRNQYDQIYYSLFVVLQLIFFLLYFLPYLASILCISCNLTNNCLDYNLDTAREICSVIVFKLALRKVPLCLSFFLAPSISLRWAASTFFFIFVISVMMMMI